MKLTDEHTRGRNNVWIWNRVNWDNPFCAIARRLNVTRKSVQYQARKRGIKTKFRHGDRLRDGSIRPYIEGPEPLPENLPQL